MKNLYEYLEYKKIYTTISDEEVMEMANISSKKTGIENVVIWIGPNPKFHGKRIKVSNSPNKFCKDDCFTITIPDFEIIGKVNHKLISNKTLEKIIEFIKINIDVICAFSDELILTDELVDSLVPVK